MCEIREDVLVNAVREEEKVLVGGFEGMAAVEVVTRAYDHSAALDASPAELAWGNG